MFVSYTTVRKDMVSSTSAAGSRKASASSIRRKSTGHPSAVSIRYSRLTIFRSFLISLRYLILQDDSRLLKRKEQNRAAQRAFRERKEKHVKDVSIYN